MSDNLAKITLECLTNQDQYQNYYAKNDKILQKDKTTDVRFYKKRIVELTKYLVNNAKNMDNQTIVGADIQHSFDIYIKSCIDHFKMVDTNDIIQDEYKEFDTQCDVDSIQTIKQGISSGIMSTEQCIQRDQNLLIAQQVLEPNPLEKMIIRVTNNTTKKTTQPIPTKKKINLKNPELENKSFVGKNNITKQYDEGSKKENDEYNQQINKNKENGNI